MTRARAVLSAVVVLFSASVASAQGVGFVAGGTVDPEQFYAGTFFETPSIGGTIHIRPGIDGSWGQGLSIAAINIDIMTRGQIANGWEFYTGGGPTISIVKFSGVSDTEVTGGFTAVFGFMSPKGFLVEVRYGSAAGGPSLKFGAGFQVGKKP